MKPRPRHSKYGRSSMTSPITSSARRLPSQGTTRLYWFSTSQRPSCSWTHQLVHRLQDVQRLEPGGHQRLAVAGRDELVGPAADHRRHVARAEEAVQAQVGGVEDRLDRRDDRDVVAEDREVLDPLAGGPQHGHRRGRRGGLEADGHEHHALVRVVARDLQGVERGVDHPDVGAGGLGVEERPVAAGHAHHVAERRHDHVGFLRDRDRVVDPAHRQDADRAAGAVHEPDRLGQVVLEAVLVDRVRVAAADLHEGVAAAGLAQLGDAGGHRPGRVGVAELVDELHSPSLPIRRRTERSRRSPGRRPAPCRAASAARPAPRPRRSWPARSRRG